MNRRANLVSLLSDAQAWANNKDIRQAKRNEQLISQLVPLQLITTLCKTLHSAITTMQIDYVSPHKVLQQAFETTESPVALGGLALSSLSGRTVAIRKTTVILQ